MQEPETAIDNEATQIRLPAQIRSAPPPSGLIVGQISDVGKLRERNEDSFFSASMRLQYHQGEEPFGVYVVADGMGGHQKGNEASSLAARVAAHSIITEVYLPYLNQDYSANNRPITEALSVAVEQANNAVLNQVPEGGTTLVLAMVMGNTAYLGHVGDSRAYIYHNHTLKQITQDHSLAQKLTDMGKSHEEAMKAQNVLYRAIGQSEALEVDTYIQRFPSGAMLLLCSDGLWGLVTDEQIAQVLALSPTPQLACNQLITLANENGGRDNITAILVAMG
jgi:protein phosphatase